MNSIVAANPAAMGQNVRALNAFERYCLTHRRKLTDLKLMQRQLEKDLFYNICSVMNF